jgi:hypothetical protein
VVEDRRLAGTPRRFGVVLDFVGAWLVPARVS